MRLLPQKQHTADSLQHTALRRPCSPAWFRPHPSALILVLALPCLLLAAEPTSSRPRMLCSWTAAGLYGGLVQTRYTPYIGLNDARLEVVDLGIGVSSGNSGLMLSVKAGELFPSGYSGDFIVLAALAPLYLHAFQRPLPSVPTVPTLHLYAGTAYPHRGLYLMEYVHVGVGAEWSRWILRPSVQAAWRRVWLPDAQVMHEPHFADILTAGLQLEIGYRWSR